MKLDNGMAWLARPMHFVAASTRASSGVVARHAVLLVTVLACVLATVYWLAIASDRYVSEARVLVQRTSLPGGQQAGESISSLLGGAGPGRADQLLLREHLMSLDMLRKVDATLNLRSHFSSNSVDPISRMWWKDAPLEWLHRHYKSRVSVEFDDYAGVLTISAQAYDSDTAHRITQTLVAEGERFMNDMANGIALAQVQFLERQVAEMYQRVLQARRAVLAYQESKGLLSPTATAENTSAVVARLEAQRADLQIQRTALQSYLVAEHPSVAMLTQQIAAVEGQLVQERAKLVAPSGKTLNRSIEEFQRLQAEAEFRQDVYRTTLAALEKGQIEAHRASKKVSVLQAPSAPEYAVLPHRLYNIVAFIVIACVVAGILQMLIAIVRDHTD